MHSSIQSSAATIPISSLQLEVPEIVNEIKFWFLYPSFLVLFWLSFSHEIEVMN